MPAARFRATPPALASALAPVAASPVLRRLLPAFAVSAVGDGMSAVGVAWLAIRIAPPGHRGLAVGLAVATYTLPGAAGAVRLARPLRALAARHLVAADAALRAVTFTILAVTAVTVRAGPRPAGPAASGPADRAAGFSAIARSKPLAGLLALTVLYYFLYGPVEMALPLYVTGPLGGGAGMLGLFWMMFGIGATAGSVIAGLARRLPVWPVLLAAVLGWGAAIAALGGPLSAWLGAQHTLLVSAVATIATGAAAMTIRTARRRRPARRTIKEQRLCPPSALTPN